MTSAVTQNNIEELKTIGATCIKGLFSELEMSEIETAVDDVISKPGAMCDVFETDSNGKAVFFNDFNNWRRIPTLRSLCLSEKIGVTARNVLASKNAFLFHDHLIVKNKGASKATPWHIDKTYFMLDALKTVSLWIPTVNVKAEEALKFASGSHLERKLLMPKSFKEGNQLESGNEFLDFTADEVESQHDIVSWPVMRGDALAFSYYTLHSAPACNFNFDRRVLSIRCFGDGATFDTRVKNPAPPFLQMGYRGEHGDPISEKWFPRIA